MAEKSIDNSILRITGFSDSLYNTITLDCDSQMTGKKLSVVCVYINDRWCSNVTLRDSHCSENIELLSLSLRPYYLPRESGKYPSQIPIAVHGWELKQIRPGLSLPRQIHIEGRNGSDMIFLSLIILLHKSLLFLQEGVSFLYPLYSPNYDPCRQNELE